MRGIDYSDQRGIFDPGTFGYAVHLIGVGGIGSTVAVALGNLGVPELHVYDADTVEARNIPPQLPYRPSDAGLYKVDSLAGYFDRQEMPTRLVTHCETVGADTPLEGVVISGVDSFEARAAIWQAVEYNSLVPLYMDGRIGGEYCQLHCVEPCSFDSVEAYKKWLFKPGEGSPLPCSERTVIHPPLALAAQVTAQLTLFARSLPLNPGVFINLKTTEQMLLK